MKQIKFIFLTILALTLTNAAFAQSRIGGRVVEIVDGKTVVIQTFNADKLTAELQYIEVPEAGQPLDQIVKKHLETLVLNKKIEFRARGFTANKSIGQLLLNGVDVSQQMIRDGAAWYALPQKNAQDYNESVIYQNNEAQAKNDKIGVWSIADLKPSWEIRAEMEANRRREEEKRAREIEDAAKKASETEAPKPKKKPTVRGLNTESQMWAQATETPFGKLPENVSTVGGLLVGYNPAVKLGFAATPLLKLDFADADGSQALGIGIAYLYADSEQKGRESIYLVGVESESRDFKFLKLNDLTITADNQKIVVGKAVRSGRQTNLGVKELLSYKITRAVFNKIAGAKNLQFKVGNYSGKVPEQVQMMLQNLSKVSE